MLSLRSSILALIAGVSLGVLAPLLETVNSPVIHAAHVVLSSGWSWAALAFLVGLQGRTKGESSTLASASLTAGVLAYYLTKAGRGDYSEPVDLSDLLQGVEVNWTSFASKVIFWCIMAIPLGAMLGLSGNMARRNGYRGLGFQVIVPLVAVFETVMRLRTEANLQGETASATWTATLLISILVIITLVTRAAVYSNRSPESVGRRQS